MIQRPAAFALVCTAVVVFACSGEDASLDERTPTREPGELALPPSANAPRVMREAEPPDTLEPDSFERFEIVGLDSFPFVEPGGEAIGPDPTVDSITEAYRQHYAETLQSEGSAVQGRIDRQLQQEAERRTAADRGFSDWTEMIGALSPEERARLVDRLNEANVEMARDLHGPTDEQEPTGTAPPG